MGVIDTRLASKESTVSEPQTRGFDVRAHCLLLIEWGQFGSVYPVVQVCGTLLHHNAILSRKHQPYRNSFASDC